MKKISIISSAIFSLALAHAASANTITANRTLCIPQDHDMSTGPFTSTCYWSRWSRGDDADALITLTGKKKVHADCIYAGSNPIALIHGTKQTSVNVVLPGDQFGFDIGYNNDSDSNENQNLSIYLTYYPPTADNILTCTFTPK